jgi:hypothetical protein
MRRLPCGLRVPADTANIRAFLTRHKRPSATSSSQWEKAGEKKVSELFSDPP